MKEMHFHLHKSSKAALSCQMHEVTYYSFVWFVSGVCYLSKWCLLSWKQEEKKNMQFGSGHLGATSVSRTAFK